MRNNQFTFILVGVLFLCTLWTVLQLVRYNRSIARLQDTKPRNDFVAQYYSQGIMRPMVIDLAEYAKKNPVMDPLLQPFGIQIDRSGAAK